MVTVQLEGVREEGNDREGNDTAAVSLTHCGECRKQQCRYLKDYCSHQEQCRQHLEDHDECQKLWQGCSQTINWIWWHKIGVQDSGQKQKTIH